MSSWSTGEDLECSFSPGHWLNTLLTKSLCDTILSPDFRWQLRSKSMDPLDNCILYFGRWVCLDFGVGCLGFFWFCLVWVCLGFFTIFIQTALMAVYNSRLGMLVLLFKKSFNNWHCKLCQSWAVLASSRAVTAVLAITNCYFLPPCSWNCHVLLRECTQVRQVDIPLWNVSVLTQHQELVQSSSKLVFPLALHPIKYNKMLL